LVLWVQHVKWNFNIVTLISQRLIVLFDKFKVIVIFLAKLSAFIIEYFFIFHLFNDRRRLIEFANDVFIRWAISPVHLLIDGLIVLNSTCIFILPILRSNNPNLFRDQIYLRNKLPIHSISQFLTLETFNTQNISGIGLNKFFIFNNWAI
jgi:hypothetical protein